MTNLQLQPIIDQTVTCYYKTGKVISKYLKPLTKNEFVINNTQDFLAMLNNVPISENKEHVSYDISLSSHHHYLKSGKKLVFRYHFVKEMRRK